MNINETLQEAIRCHQEGKYQEAEARYREILHLIPEHADACHNLGLIAMQVGRPAIGLPYLQSALKTNPHNERVSLTLTECLLRMDRSAEALQVLRDAVRHRGVYSAQAGLLQELAESIVEGRRPSLSKEHDLLTLFSAGRHAVLEEKLSTLLIQYPVWWAGWDMLCTTREILGKDADDALERVLQLMPESAQCNRTKIFCIGANKTGTTSVEAIFKSLGLAVGNQMQAEMLIYDWAKQDYRRIIGYCRSAEAFQDVPFSLQATYKALDVAFPGSKFILTVRNNSSEWYESLVRFHTKIVNKGRIPTINDLQQLNYRFPGFLLDILKLSFGAEKPTLYNREVYVKYYEDHIDQVIEYFRSRPDDLLVLNVETPDAMERLVKFLGYPFTGQKMPHLNPSKQ